MLEFGVLGPLAVWEDGRELSLRAAKRRAVLALLLLRANEVVPTARLIDALWGERPPARAVKTVQVYVSELRKALGAGVVETRPGGYLLSVEPDALDLDRFESLLGRGQALLGAGAADEAGAVLREALTLWRGPALSDLEQESFARDEIARLEELRLVALTLRLEADLAQGRHAEVVPELEALVREHPLRERLRELLILALYREGRQADALAAYHDARTTLVDELGLEPSQSLRDLEKAILVHDPGLAVTTRSLEGLPRTDEGRRALEAAQWEAAREAFESALEVEETPDALEGLGLALWFLGDVSGAVVARERAVEGYARAGRCDDAARLAVWVSHQHFVGGRQSAARGWLARAERAVGDANLCAGQGWVAVERARHAETVDECAEQARRALEIARQTNADDLEVFAVSVLGRAEISAGRTDEGMVLLEEAMAAASAGRVRNVHTLAEAYCNLIDACTSAGDWERATEWCGLVDEFAREHEAAPLYGSCRTIHADVLLATGRWDDAEHALQTALDVHARYVPQLAAPTVATLAELRVRQGRLAEAEQLLVGREEHPETLRALAHLRVAQGRPSVAAALLGRGLRAAEGDVVQTAQLLAALVDARLDEGEVGSADVASRSLAEVAEASGIVIVEARAALAAARVHVAAGHPDEAAEAARRSLTAFGALAMPYEVAQARLELARALADESPELAVEEARAAYATFRDLGASRARDAAAAVLRGLGTGTGGLPRAAGELTAREHEVLSLLALGMSNGQIAETLVISEKTAGHHVSHILSKLGVRNRAEAAAFAARSESASTTR